jgi:hypothetical protein
MTPLRRQIALDAAGVEEVHLLRFDAAMDRLRQDVDANESRSRSRRTTANLRLKGLE